MSSPWRDLELLSRLGWSCAVTGWADEHGEPLGITLRVTRDELDFTVRAASFAEAMPLLLERIADYAAVVGASSNSLR